MKKWIDTALPPVVVSLVFAALTLTLCGWASALFSDSDSNWHIAVGDLIRSTGSVHLKEEWSFTAKGHPWRDTAWLWDVLQSWVHEHAGLQGVLALASALLASACACITWRCLALRCNLLSTLLTTLMVMITLVMTSRPQMVTFLITLATATVLYTVRRDPRRWLLLAWLPPLTALWTNLHGGFLIIFTIIGAYGLDALLRRAWREVWALAVTGVACALAVLVNPYGIGIIGTVTDMMGSKAHTFIAEWQPMPFSYANLLMLFPIPLFLVLVKPGDPRFSFAEKLLGFVWLLLSVNSWRHYSVFVMLAAPMMAVAMHPFFVPRADQKKGWEPAIRFGRRVGQWADTMGARAAVLALALAVALAAATPLAERIYYPETLQVPQHALDPMIAFVEKNYPDLHFYNDYNFGGYLVYKTRGKLPVFIDGREQPAYTPDVIDAFLAYRHGNADWQEQFAHFGVEGLILQQGTNNDYNLISPPCTVGWTLVYSDTIARVYVKDALARTPRVQ